MDKYFKNNFIRIALLSGISTVLMFIEFPLPFFPIFLKFDFSDLPALIGAFAIGPVAGLIIEFVKNILHGVLISFTIFVVTAGIIYRLKKTKVNALIGLLSGTILMGIGASILNYYLFLPLYEKV